MHSRPAAALRVVVLDHTAELGGAELALVRMLDALPRAAADVRVLLLSDGPLVERLRGHGHTVEVVALDPSVATASRTTSGPAAVAQALRTGPSVLRLASRLRALDPHLVHTTSLKADLLGLAAARLARVPVVWHVHDRIESDYLPGGTVRLLREAARRGPRAVVANSRATAATLPGVTNLAVVYPGLAPEQILDRLEDRPAREPVVGMLGRLSPTKGQLEAVRAASLVVAERPEVRVRIVGSPMFGAQQYATQVRAEIARLGLSDQVSLTGFVDDPTRLLDTFAVLVHASPVPEPFGQVVVEAMARGVAVVATRAGGIPEILTDVHGRPRGWLVEPGDVTDLARGVLAALDAGPHDPRLQAGWDAARHQLTAAATASGVLEVWSRVAQSR